MNKLFKLLIGVWILIICIIISSCGSVPDFNNDDTIDRETEQANNNQENDNNPLSSDTDVGPSPSDLSDNYQEENEDEPITDDRGIAITEIDPANMNKRLMTILQDYDLHGIEDHTKGILASGDVFILNERFEEDVYTDIPLGSSFDDIRRILGTPGWETDSILLYKCPDFYLLFQGNGTAQYSVLAKAPDTQYDKDILENMISSINGTDYISLETSLTENDPKGSFFNDSGFITGGGFYASSDQGIIIFDFEEQYIEIYNNFTGKLDILDKPRFEVRFINSDMVVEGMLAELNHYQSVEELFESEAVISPDKKLSAVYEWLYSEKQYFIIRTLDHSIQDRYIYASTFSNFYWLTSSHLIYIDAYNDLPYAIDVDFSDPTAINILYEADIIDERDADFGKYSFEIMSIKDDILTLKDKMNNKNYKIQIIEGRNGDITFKAVP